MTFMNKRVTIYYIDIEDICWDDISPMINILSIVERKKINNLRQERDKCLSLMGKLLLLHYLNQYFNYTRNCIPKIEYTVYGKPFFQDLSVSFNISHSGDMVICACSNIIHNIGVDIEKVSYIDFEAFKEVFSDNEHEILMNKQDLSEFIRLWTVKEAIIKADGRGFSIDPKLITISNNIGCIENNSWFIHSWKMNTKYYISLASEFASNIFLVEIGLKELISVYGI